MMKNNNNNIFTDMGFSKEEEEDLQFRSFLMNIIVQFIQEVDWSQKEAANYFNVSISCISNLVHGRIDLFSMGALLALLKKGRNSYLREIS